MENFDYQQCFGELVSQVEAIIKLEADTLEAEKEFVTEDKVIYVKLSKRKFADTDEENLTVMVRTVSKVKRDMEMQYEIYAEREDGKLVVKDVMEFRNGELVESYLHGDFNWHLSRRIYLEIRKIIDEVSQKTD
jgi:hypothetical protein